MGIGGMSGTSTTAERPRTVAVIQARSSSSRLPGKVLQTIGDRASILFMCDRVRRARSIDQLCVATSLEASDDPLVDCLESAGIAVFRGSLDDVLGRFAGAARHHEAGIVVRLTGDCPLADPDLVDQVVERLISGQLDYASNIDPPTFPDGLDVEAMTMAALSQAEGAARLLSEREHVTLFMRNNPDRFRMGCVRARADLSHLRWTIDYPDDLELVRRLVRAVEGDPVVADRFDFLRAYEGLELDALNDHLRNEGLASSLMRDRADDTVLPRDD